MKCAEKWSYGHQCAATVQLNALQELWELFQLDEEEQSDKEVPEESTQLCLMLSQAALTGKPAPKTMYMIGEIQGHEVSILIDSGSSHTFISAALAGKLSGLSEILSGSSPNG